MSNVESLESLALTLKIELIKQIISGALVILAVYYISNFFLGKKRNRLTIIFTSFAALNVLLSLFIKLIYSGFIPYQ
jgi:hypothetical protein